MLPSYQKLPTPLGPAYVSANSKGTLTSIDSIVFDCDGVLIDTRESYDAAIIFTADYLIRRMFNLALPWRRSCRPLIQGLRNTGRFNNDWDIVYGIALFVSCSLPSENRDDFSTKPAANQPSPRRMSRKQSGEVFQGATKLLEVLAAVSVEGRSASGAEMVWKVLPKNKLELCQRVRETLGYPGNPPTSLLASLFDEVYHGGALYREMYGSEPRFHPGPGFIERDRVVIRRSDLASLARASGGRLAVATGRSRIAAEYSLGNLISYFKLDASVFIGDGDIRPSREAASFRKPSGKSLLLARSKLHSKALLYVGDSAEDLQMVRNARRSVDGLAFAGIYASSYEPARQVRFFKEEGAELILPSIRAMTKVMGAVAVK